MPSVCFLLRLAAFLATWHLLQMWLLHGIQKIETWPRDNHMEGYKSSFTPQTSVSFSKSSTAYFLQFSNFTSLYNSKYNIVIKCIASTVKCIASRVKCIASRVNHIASAIKPPNSVKLFTLSVKHASKAKWIIVALHRNIIQY